MSELGLRHETEQLIQSDFFKTTVYTWFVREQIFPLPPPHFCHILSVTNVLSKNLVQ